MDDDDVPHCPDATPPELSAFSTYPPTSAATVWPLPAADALLGGGGVVLEGAEAMACSLDECDVWDGVDEKDEMVPVVGVEGEEDDLMLDMLRSQQDGQFIIAGESVIGDAELVTGFASVGGGDRGEVQANVEFGHVVGRSFMEGIALNPVSSVELEEEDGNRGNSGFGEVVHGRLPGEEACRDAISADVEPGTTCVGLLSLDRGGVVVSCKQGRGEAVEGKTADSELGNRGSDVSSSEDHGVAGKPGGLDDAAEKVENMTMGLGTELPTMGLGTELPTELDDSAHLDSSMHTDMPVEMGGLTTLDVERGDEAGECGETSAVEINREVDINAVARCAMDGLPMEGKLCPEGQADVVVIKQGETEAGEPVQDDASLDEMVMGNTASCIDSMVVVGDEGGGEELVVGNNMEPGITTVGELDDLTCLDSSTHTDMAVEMGGFTTVDGMGDSQLIDATASAAADSGKDENAVRSVPEAGPEETVKDIPMDVTEDPTAPGSTLTRGPGRKKRGRQPKVQVPKPSKKGEEDVCFICFDGGNLVVCDRRGCPKVYHPSCINRDESFFRARGRWNCGWHICSICQKTAHQMCYTCTYSLCKGCIKQSNFFCIRGNKGLCESCRGMVMLIETKDPAAANFYDRNSWDYLFKDYWMDVKAKLSLTFDEITKGKKSSKKAMIRNEESSDEVYEANEGASSSDSSSVRVISNRKRAKSRPLVLSNEESSVTVADSEGSSFLGDANWASKELLEFVSHMKDGDTTVLSQFDVQALLLKYIKQNNLRDPRRKSQIICDSRLQSLFGKARVGHFEMLKLLELHFLIKEVSNIAADNQQIETGDLDSSHVDAEGSTDAVKMVPEKKRKGRKKENREHQMNFDEYAAVDVHNISLIYLRRNLMEELLDDAKNFNEKVVGSFVRIRIPASGLRQDMYRLVKVIGTTKTSEKYTIGKRVTETMLEILNLNKTEVISIDTISNQEFTEEECKRLRQSIKYGIIPRMTVGELHEKARDLQTVKVNDWLETEKARLSHLRDRASETGRRKQLRECVERLEFLPEEHSRKLTEIPEVHSDPNMDPDYESAEEEPEERKRDNMCRQRGSGYFRKGSDTGSSEKQHPPNDNWSGARKGPVCNSEPRNVGDSVLNSLNTKHASSWDRCRDMPPQHASESLGNQGNNSLPQNVGPNTESAGQLQPSATLGSTQSSLNGMMTVSTRPGITESEKIWHYQDPSGKIQGPFSMVQLRKWNATGYFPRDLRIWKASERQEDSILLADALIGKFEKEPSSSWVCQQSNAPHSLNPPSVMDSRDCNQRGSNNSWVEKRVGVQYHGGTWSSGRLSSSFQSNGASCDRLTNSTATTFHQLPAQQGSIQPPTSSFGINSDVGCISANKSSAAFGSNISGSARGNQIRTRVSRWEPEPGATAFMHGVQVGTEVSPKIETSASRNSTSVLVSMDSPTPKNEQLRGFTSVNNFLKSTTSTNTATGSTSDSALAKSSQDKCNLETTVKSSQFPDNQNMQNNFSPIRAASSGIPPMDPGVASGSKHSTPSEIVASGMQPSSSSWNASADVKKAEWSMPSPTPTPEVVRIDVATQVAQGNNAQPFSDGSRHLATGQLKPDSLVGPAQQIPPQGQGQMGIQSSGWGFTPENSTVCAMVTQASAGWGAAVPPNGNMGWVASGPSNVGWTAVPQGNTNIVGWVPGAAGTPIVNAVPQVAAGAGVINPVAGWGAVAQVPPVNACWGMQPTNVNSGWGGAMTGYPNANPAWGVQQPVPTDPSLGWSGQLPGNSNTNVGWGVPNGKPNAGWTSPSGNPNARGPHQRDQKDRFGRSNGESGQGGAWHRAPSSGGLSRDSQVQRGICKYHESGHCKKGTSCNFLHT